MKNDQHNVSRTILSQPTELIKRPVF